MYFMFEILHPSPKAVFSSTTTLSFKIPVFLTLILKMRKGRPRERKQSLRHVSQIAINASIQDNTEPLTKKHTNRDEIYMYGATKRQARLLMTYKFLLLVVCILSIFEIFIKGHFISVYWDDLSISVFEYIYGFTCIKPSLHLWDGANLVMMICMWSWIWFASILLRISFASMFIREIFFYCVLALGQY